MAQIQRVLRSLGFPSSDIEDVVLSHPGGSIRLALTREVEPDEYVTGGLDFAGVRAYRYRAESQCTAWHVEAYGSLNEISDSEWVAELVEATPEDLRPRRQMRHFMTYLDGYGCYEIVAASYAVLPESPADGGRDGGGHADR